MIPIRDDVPRKTFPFITYALILANAAVFIHELALGPALDRFLLHYGVVPARLLAHGHLTRDWRRYEPLFTSMFLHGGWLHIISNMWVLFIFGDNVEDRLGHLRYLWFYLLCGLAAGATQAWAAWGSTVPTIGASGAIAGVMGAFFVLYPFARVTTLIPIFIIIRAVDIPASIFLGIWLWTQIVAGRTALGAAGRLGGVAWWAHVGGFAFGIMLLGLFLPDKRPTRA